MSQNQAFLGCLGALLTGATVNTLLCTPPGPAGAQPAVVGAPPPNPVTLAVEFWRTIPLPVPKPGIPPGYAITGKTAYLVTHGTTAPAAFEENTPIGPLSIRATGQYVVDWGDGTSPVWAGPYPTEGEPWPDGRITHVYDIAGTYTVTVREEWSAVWELAGATGNLQGLATTAAIPGFRAEQLQAVITN